jgi:hypothetical protein
VSAKNGRTARGEPGRNGAGRQLFAFEARHQGRQIAVIQGREADGGVVVETEVFAHGTGEGTRRPFAFTSLAQAQQFVDEALTALEYLDCTIVE